MFRKPREAEILPSIKPSTGRAPTPPNETSRASMTTKGESTSIRVSSTTPLAARVNTSEKTGSKKSVGKSNTKAKGAGQSNGVAKTPAKSNGTPKAAAKPNGNILNFFKKVDGPIKDEKGLFVGNVLSNASQGRDSSPDIYDADDATENRHQELGGSVKRRRLSFGSTSESIPRTLTNEDSSKSKSISSRSSPQITTPPADMRACSPPPRDSTTTLKAKPRGIGGFIEDSNSEGEGENLEKESLDVGTVQILQENAILKEEDEIQSRIAGQPNDMNWIVDTLTVQQSDIQQNMPIVPRLNTVRSLDGNVDDNPPIPTLIKEETSYDEYGDFEDGEDFLEDDEFGDGEEFRERRWMEEQAKIEAAETGNLYMEDSMTPSCPICETSLDGFSDEEASKHVNSCLDSPPVLKNAAPESDEVKMMPLGAVARFSRAAVARPGQANPFDLGSSGATPSSAFAKLMSSKAEDAAWASAAAAENASRGKQAYQRTCPFYKIMPGFFICVDAFRYGAVQGCKAYFLSHFHSDHYIGLTSSWCHGPIYCSKVTANLVKQQLRVDPKWVVALDFEAKFEVPGTEGVAVTMIPANHCPGSSLYLFEKILGRGANPKIQRVLHCGDFRACPAHVKHPLLMPDIVDTISRKVKQQKIDVCYLDTTYLNPKYAFPPQEDVIKSCADMCVSLSKDKAEESDAWEVTKRERAGAGMVKFVNAAGKDEDSIAMEVGSTKTRGKLLVACGTYSIGKERICMGIARALDCKIWAPPGKQRICAALEDPELMSRLTNDPREAQIHMQMLMEIRAETLQDYLNGFKPHFSRIVGFRPSGWNYRPPNSRFLESPSVQTVLTSQNWKSRYTMAELVPQRGSTREASCFGVPYSEHSSFRELTLFCCALRIERIIPTVNVGSAASRAKMKTWIDRWLAERRKNGTITIGEGQNEVKW